MTKHDLKQWTVGLKPNSLIMILDNACTLTYEDIDQYIDTNNFHVKIKRGPLSAQFVKSFVSAGYKHNNDLFAIIISDPGKFINQEAIDECSELMGNKFTIITEG